MFTAKVYRVMVGSLSGAMEEVYVAKETIRKWNQQNAERTGILFMLVEWTAKEEYIQHVDVVIGIVGNWVNNANSGFIEDCVEKGKQVILLFRAFNDPNNTIVCEQEEVILFMKRNQVQSHIACFHGMTEFSVLLNDCLDCL